MLVPGSFGADSVTSVAVDGAVVSAPQFVVNGKTTRAITLTRPANGAAREVSVAYAVTTPTVNVGDLTVTEGHSGTTQGNVPVTLSAPSASTVTVNFSATPGTATTPADYTRAPGSIQFAPFQTAQSIPVTIAGDLLQEGNHSFSVNLTGATNANIGDGTGIVTITDDDAPPGISIGDATVVEGNSGPVAATFTVSLAFASGATVSAQWATANNTALAGSDYTAGSGTVTFTPGQMSQPVVVQVLGDTVLEPNETFAVNLTNPVNGTLTDAQGGGTITNDDSAGAGTTTTFPVLSGADDVNQEGTAFTADNSTVWVGNAASPTASFSGFRFANLAIPPGAVIGSARLELRAASQQWLSMNFEFAVEQSANSAPFSASSPPGSRTLFPQRVLHASDAQWLAGTWYQLDQLNALVQAAINQPGWASGNALSIIVRGTGQTWARKFATAFEGGAAFAPRLVVTYSAAGPSMPAMSISDVSVTEGNSGTTNAIFTVSLSASSTQPVTVTYATANSTAQSGTDYVAGSGTLTFAPGQTSQTLAVAVNGDAAAEPNETFFVDLSGPTNATLADAQGIGTITNDDAGTTLAIGNASVAEGNTIGGQLSFTVTLSPASGQTVTVNYATVAGTADASDFTATSGSLSFAAGETSKAVSVTVTGDTVPEPDETMAVMLSSPVNATLGTATGQGTITNDDSPALSIGNVTLAEGTGGTTAFNFAVTLSPASTQPVTVAFATANGTATAGSDFTAASGTLTFNPGVTTRTATVNVTADAISEANEQFTVQLSAPTNATISGGTGVGTINNDDVPALSIADATVPEGNAGTSIATFTVSLSASSPVPVSVTYATANGTATAGSDYTAVPPTVLTIPANTLSGTLTVTVTGDTAGEANETFVVNLSAPVNATIADAQGVGTITNDEAGPVTVTVTFPVAAGADDVNEVTNTLTVGDASMWVGNASSATASFTAFRFANVTIPAGAIVTSARLEVNAASTLWQRMAFEYGADAAANSPAFTTTARPSQRVLLAPRVTHTSDAQWIANTRYQLEQIAPILQAVIGQTGWTSGNAVSLVLRGTGGAWARKFIRGFEGGAATAPRLVVTYQVTP